MQCTSYVCAVLLIYAPAMQVLTHIHQLCAYHVVLASHDVPTHMHQLCVYYVTSPHIVLRTYTRYARTTQSCSATFGSPVKIIDDLDHAMMCEFYGFLGRRLQRYVKDTRPLWWRHSASWRSLFTTSSETRVHTLCLDFMAFRAWLTRLRRY